MFPGQGSQKLGMGGDLFTRYRQLTRDADDVLGYSINQLCQQDQQKQLNQTAYTQPALYFVCCLMYLDYMENLDHHYDFLLGHSLGLFPALFAAGVFDLLTGLEIVAKRGELMQSVSGGGMLAVLGEQDKSVQDCLICHNFFDIDIANYNAPGQLVMSGKKDRLSQLEIVLTKEGYTCVLLPVSGAFHSRYMESCRLQFVEFLIPRLLRPPRKPVISSSSGEMLGADHLLEEISLQLVKPVRWFQTVQHLLCRYPRAEFKELGPGNVLVNLLIKISNTLVVQEGK